MYIAFAQFFGVGAVVAHWSSFLFRRRWELTVLYDSVSKVRDN